MENNITNYLKEPRAENNRLRDVEDLARDLAYCGVYCGWGTRFQSSAGLPFFKTKIDMNDASESQIEYRQKWGDWGFEESAFDILASFGYLELSFVEKEKGQVGKRITEVIRHYHLTSKATDLLKKPSGVVVFISYKHEESDALALALESRLIMAGAHVHIDKTLLGGQLWEDELRRRLNDSKYIVCLLGPKAIDPNGWVVKEIGWAVEAKKIIVPIVHLGTTMTACDYIQGLNPNHGYEVLKPTALNYETAINFVLNAVELSKVPTNSN